MPLREVKKQLAGKEDLLLGVGSEVQERFSGNLELTKLNTTHLDGAIVVDTIKDMIDLDRTKLKENPKVYALGYYAVGDGGGGLFYYSPNEPKTNHNGGTIIDPDKAWTEDNTWWDPIVVNDGVVLTGCFKRVYEGPVNIKWFGAKGDGVTDNYKILAKLQSLGYKVIISDGIFYTSNIPFTVNKKYIFINGFITDKLGDKKDYTVSVQLSPIIEERNYRISQGTNLTEDKLGNKHNRDELLFWAGYSRYNEYSLDGAAMHLYGKNDIKHGADVYFATPGKIDPDTGECENHDRMIIAGNTQFTNDAHLNKRHRENGFDTRVIIGNNPYDTINNDAGKDIGIITAYNNVQGRPAFYASACGSQTFGVDIDHNFGFYNYVEGDSENPPTKYLNTLIQPNGKFRKYANLSSDYNNEYIELFTDIYKDESDNKVQKFQIMFNDTLSNSPLLTLYGPDDSDNPNTFKFSYNDSSVVEFKPNKILLRPNSATSVDVSRDSDGNTVIILSDLPTSDPSIVGQLWNDSGTLKISAG